MRTQGNAATASLQPVLRMRTAVPLPAAAYSNRRATQGPVARAGRRGSGACAGGDCTRSEAARARTRVLARCADASGLLSLSARSADIDERRVDHCSRCSSRGSGVGFARGGHPTIPIAVEAAHAQSRGALAIAMRRIASRVRMIQLSMTDAGGQI